jgi:hypothetical protein
MDGRTTDGQTGGKGKNNMSPKDFGRNSLITLLPIIYFIEKK